MPAPFFSVILPVYNGAPYVGDAIASLLRQDHAQFEVIALDDGSTDRTLDVLQRHADSDRRIRVVACAHRGLVATLNEGLALARGDLVARMDADDVNYPHRLSRQAAAFEANPRLALCGSLNDAIIGSRLFRPRNVQNFATYDMHVLSLFFTLFTHASTVFNRKVIRESDLFYSEKYVYAQDLELFARLTAKYQAERIHESLLASRLHSDSFSGRNKAWQQKCQLTIVANNLKRNLAVDTTALEELGTAAMDDCISEGLVVRIADCLLAIESATERADPIAVPSYRLGVRNIFHDLFGAVQWQRPGLLPLFLDRTGKWHWVRRRDRVWLQAYRRSRALGDASRQLVAMADAAALRMQSVPLVSVLPELAPD